MLALSEVTKSYPIRGGNTVAAVRGVSLEVGRGEFVVIVGRSGSGKTTLLNLAAGLTRPTAGSVTLDGADVWAMTDKQRSTLRSETIGFVFQFPSLLASLTAQENVALPATFRPRRDGENVRARSEQLLVQVGLADKLAAYPRQLSAGQQQRVVIARALMNQPQVIVADEPTSNLDERTELEIMDLFRDLHASTGITVVMVTHTRQLIAYGTRAVEMADGRIANGDG